MASDQLTDAIVKVNNQHIGIVPGSLSYNEGLGERKLLAVSEGGGRISQVFATNQETAIGMVKFALRATAENIDLLRGWQLGRNRNVVELASDDGNGNSLTRAFTQATVSNNPEIPFSADGTISVEWESNAPI